MKYLSVIIAIIITVSCKQAVEKKDLKQTELKPTSKLDTLNADNYNVLFFHPTKTEFNELLKENGEASGLHEVDSDFGFYTNKVYDSLTKTDLKVKFVTERIIQYTTSKGIKYFDRLKDVEHPYGILFNKINCEPKIKFGVMDDLGILQELEEYNKNCK
jgi:hypothetical protein